VTSLTGRSLVALNTSADTIEMLKVWFEMHGMIVHTGLVSEFRVHGEGLDEFLEKAKPEIIIFDIAIPYETNWNFLQQLRSRGPLRDVPVIVTTTNERVLRSLVGDIDTIPVHELVGKPYDMAALLDLVTKTLPPLIRL
jgi:CheY-like chemotaxis protein